MHRDGNRWELYPRDRKSTRRAKAAPRGVGARGMVRLDASGSANLDIAISADGEFLLSLNAATDAVGMLASESNGTLTNLGTTGGLPASAGLNGIAAD